MKQIEILLQRNEERTCRIAVVGDVMIDEYCHVTADRVSPEFPIPVMRSSTYDGAFYPGGAANVCAQFKHFNVDARLFAITDMNVFNVCSVKHDIAIGYYASLPQLDMPRFAHVPVKKRVYHGDFPLCRWDRESDNFGLSLEELRKCQDELKENFPFAIDRPDEHFEPEVIIFSDYHKGTFVNDSWFPLEIDAITIVDPKFGPLDRWKGCDIFKPNAKEAKNLSGLDDWEQQCDYFIEHLECTAVVITQGADGVVGKVMGQPFEYRPNRTIDANSVVGAGDAFVAFLAMGAAHAMDIVDAASAAWEAGAKYVQSRYNKPIEPRELDPIQKKLVMPPSNDNLVFTNGCFDILHAGHIKMLKEAKLLGDNLVVAVSSDETVKKLKGDSRPIFSLEERMEILASLEFVDFVVSFDEETPYNIIKEIMPTTLVKGGDYVIEDVVGNDIINNVVIIPLVEGSSTSNIIEKIKS